MTRLFDVREGEARGNLFGFSLLLLLVIAAHTTLETVRDALLITGPGPKALGLVYIAIALGTIPGAALSARAGERFGQRRALGLTLLMAIAGPVLLFLAPTTHATAMATYVLSGILGSIVVPQFWALVGTTLTVAQSRRLFGLISAGGTVGGVLGPAVAIPTLAFFPLKTLLLVSSLGFALAAVALALVGANERAGGPARVRRIPLADSLSAFREQPFLVRVAVVVFLSTATFLALDYLFKSTVARALPRAQVAPFIAHYYLALNGVSLMVQLLVTSAVIRRLGVIPALVLTPLLLVGGAAVAITGGGVLFRVLFVKSIDGSLRYSLHRVTGELMYLPVPIAARRRAKPLIDGTLARTAQAATGAALYTLGGTSFLGTRPLAGIVLGLAALWAVTAMTTRRPYLDLLRRALTTGSFDAAESPEPLDLETAQLLVQHLASEDPFEVEGAMTALSRRGRAGFIPALVLLHEDEGVLVQALEILGGSQRTDWFGPAQRLLGDPRETVRVAAARALARHEQLDASLLANDVGWRARGYAAVRMGLRDASDADIAKRKSVTELLGAAGESGESAKLGMLAAMADAPRTVRLSSLLRLLANEPPGSREKTELLGRAAVRQQDRSIIPHLISRLSMRAGRESVRAALVVLGEPALDEVRQTMRDPQRERKLRLHMPKTLARFASKRAAEYLLEEIETESDGLIRYKAIRALQVLATGMRSRVDRRRTERLCQADLERHFRYLALSDALDAAEKPEQTAALLARELLSKKATHALERAFCLLQIAHPRQGVHHAFIACRSEDPYARANGAELVDALLRRRDQRRLRALFRLATDNLSAAERVARARSLVEIPETRVEGLDSLSFERDPMLLALARRLRTPHRARAAEGDAQSAAG